MVLCSSGDGLERLPTGLCGGVLASLWGVSARGKCTTLRRIPNCCDSPVFLAPDVPSATYPE
eukprot:666412-Alexandrium_andersonii.AAC.1